MLSKIPPFDRYVLFIAILWYLLTAWFSLGYYHADEHYQIIEFAEHFRGNLEADQLPWEFEARIRPALQPMLASAIFQVAEAFKVTDPYTQSFLLRILTGLLAILAIYYLTLNFKEFIQDRYWKYLLPVSYFLWFLPFFQIRFSSEAWGGIFLLLGIATLLRAIRSGGKYWLAGVFLGFSFVFRYQMALSILGIFLWIIIIKRSSIRNITGLIAGSILPVIVAVLCDSLFYEQYTFAPWNYFTFNILQDGASSFGAVPWHNYIFYIFRYPFFVFGLPILLALVFLLIRKPKSILIWIIVPFIIGHSLIPHKELRFLFPLMGLTPVVLLSALSLWNLQLQNKTMRLFISGALGIIILINLIGLFTASFKPAGFGRMAITKSISEQAANGTTDLYCYENANPYDPWGGLTAHFYFPERLNIYPLDDKAATAKSILDSNNTNLFVTEVKHLKEESIQCFISDNHFELWHHSVPNYLIPILKLYGNHTEELLVLFRQQ